MTVRVRARQSATVPAGPQRLTRWEIVGAWLHIWTAPRGLEVPPVPWRKLGVWALAGLVVAGAAAAIAVPRIDAGKQKGAAERARVAAAADAAERSRLRADQRVHFATAAGAGSMVASLEAAISADARGRVQAKTITGPVIHTRCRPTSAAVAQFPRSRVYKCFVTTATGLHGEGGDVLGTGYPFVGTIYEHTRRLAWCKQNPNADEKGTHGAIHVRVSPVCAGKLSEVL